ncbi:MAG: cysteine hydrolase [Deltaproteobacteria bacterium]|nr:cysteine hydrolase [Deltaproteobacteria bacterium]
MDVNDFDISKSAILFFDLLNSFIHSGDEKARAKKAPMVANAVRLMKAGRASGMPMFFAMASHHPSGATASNLITDTDTSLKPWADGKVAWRKPHALSGDGGSQVIAELEPRPDDYYIPKCRYSAFHQTYLDLALRTRGIDTLIISGGSTDVGVCATVFAARDYDYNLIIARDGCATSHDPRAHDALMDLIFPRMARVRTTGEILTMIGPSR